MHKIVESRCQMNITCLDDLITPDSYIRLLEYIIEDVIVRGDIDIPTGKNVFGRRPYSAKDLVKLYVYGYINGITSCRSLHHETQVNIEVMWLMRRQQPCPKTISDFRKNHKSFIDEVYKKSIIFLMDEGLITNNTWALDGYKVKGNAKRDMHCVKKLRKQHAETKEKIEQFIKELEEDTTGSQENESKQTQLSDLVKDSERIGSLIAEAESKDQNYISETDKDALLVTTRRGKCAGYNTQLVVDSTNNLIVGTELADICNDTKSLYSVIKSTVDNSGSKPATVLADRGYTNFQDIRKVYEEITDGVRVILQKSSREKEGFQFAYDVANNQVICPQGKVMNYKGKSFHKGAMYYAYKCKECSSCPVKAECTKSPEGRVYRISENHDFIEMYKALMKKEESKKATKKRKTIVEHVFGTIGQMMHHNGFKLRGRSKVMTELHLYSLAYNMKRLFNMVKRGHPSGYIGKLRLKCAFSFFFLILAWILSLLELIMSKLETKYEQLGDMLPAEFFSGSLLTAHQNRVFAQPLKPVIQPTEVSDPLISEIRVISG